MWPSAFVHIFSATACILKSKRDFPRLSLGRNMQSWQQQRRLWSNLNFPGLFLQIKCLNACSFCCCSWFVLMVGWDALPGWSPKECCVRETWILVHSGGGNELVTAIAQPIQGLMELQRLQMRQEALIQNYCKICWMSSTRRKKASQLHGIRPKILFITGRSDHALKHGNTPGSQRVHLNPLDMLQFGRWNCLGLYWSPWWLFDW